MRKGNEIPFGARAFGQSLTPNDTQKSVKATPIDGVRKTGGQGDPEETKEPKKKMHVGTAGLILGKKDTIQMVSVKPILEAFKRNTPEGKDVKKQYARMKELEKGDENNIVQALDQLTDILCQAAYFQKAYDILKLALSEYENNGLLNEIMARICFIMEQFD